MKKYALFALFSSSILLLSSCSVVEGIFKAGVWSGVILVVIVIVLVIWLLSKLFGGRRDR